MRSEAVNPSGTRRMPREIKAWHLLAALAVIIAVDVAWAWSSW